MERAEAALDSLDKACQLGLRGLELHVNRGRTLALLYRMEEAEREFVTAVGLDQTHIDAQVNLARLRYMRGDAAFARDFRIAADAHLAYLALQTSYLTVLRCAGLFDLAQTHLQRLMDHHGPLPALRAQLAQVLQVADRLPEAELQALAAAAGDPGSADIIETLVLIQLAGGKAAEAREHILRQRSGRPNAQNWLAYEASALRLLGDPAYRQLVDYDRHVRCFEVQPPTGWRSIAHFNADLLQALKQRHPFASHPLDQSLRHGSQTTRNLLAETDAIIRAALDAFAPPLRDYVAGIGQAATHPLSARSTGAAAMVGAWSVRLHRDGFHVNHVHPEGWISSAYYVDVPDEVRDVNLRSGWLKFGEPRFAIPGAVPEHFVQPRQGLLVLFPSFVWHGTNAIRGDAPRTSIAFDAVPVPLV
jgi:Flp pilus assembly protein TadD